MRCPSDAAGVDRGPSRRAPSRVLNDVHSGLNATRVAGVHRPRTAPEVGAIVESAAASGRAVSVAGGRHAMGGQQFGAGTVHIDCTALDRVLEFDAEAGQVEAGAGIAWPALVERLGELQPGEARPWTIRQKQTGADRLTLGGAVSANIHGRGLMWAPLVGDIESVTLVNAQGCKRRVSRTRHPELFSLVVGGYGLFGVITAVRLRLARRRTLQRDVEIISAEELPSAFAQRIGAGYMLGDWQFAIDSRRSDFLRLGVFSCYRPVADAEVPAGQRSLGEADWLRLLDLAHRDKHAGFQAYARHYLGTHGQLYRSDECQMATYLDDYHRALPAPACHGSEMITEVYVSPGDVPAFLARAAGALRRTGSDVIYGTVRLAARDTETFLPWAQRDCAGVIFNLHVERGRAGVERAAESFRALIDAAIDFGGSYYLTYHRFARREQVLRCHPRIGAFLEAKLRHDPGEVFRSEWYRHTRGLLSAR
jgi:FAD/FMN-containing dehydrogenase